MKILIQENTFAGSLILFYKFPRFLHWQTICLFLVNCTSRVLAKINIYKFIFIDFDIQQLVAHCKFKIS